MPGLRSSISISSTALPSAAGSRRSERTSCPLASSYSVSSVMAPVAALLGIDILPPVLRRRCCCFTAPSTSVHEIRARYIEIQIDERGGRERRRGQRYPPVSHYCLSKVRASSGRRMGILCPFILCRRRVRSRAFADRVPRLARELERAQARLVIENLRGDDQFVRLRLLDHR